MSEFPRGSEWRKWDMHIHTPGTAKNDNYGRNAWEEYYARLESQPDTIAYGITDYCSIGNYLKVREAQKQGRLRGKFIFPNIEFRIKPVTDSRTPINLHVLFDPELATDVIKREFFSKIEMEYMGCHYSCTEADLIAFGRKVNPEVTDNESALKSGIGQFAVDYSLIRDALSSRVLQGHYLVGVSNSSHDGASGIQESAMLANRQEIYRMSHLIFSARSADIEYFLGRGCDSPKKVIDEYGSIKPCVRGSDAHSLDQIGVYESNRATWIKADPTFEGLMQIIIEPEDRVRIQEESPELDFDKATLSEICINSRTPVFATDNDVYLAPARIQLNSGLVSIIGGRGTGKSVLVDYLSSGLGLGSDPMKYTCKAGGVVVFGKPSSRDHARTYDFKEDPIFKYIYISQGKIKDLIKDKHEFTKNIRETIGVLSDYEIPQSLSDLLQKTINEYYRIMKALCPNGGSPEEYKHSLNDEVKKYSAFIENITSEANREKLEKYARLVEKKNRLSAWRERTRELISDAMEFMQSYNARIAETNELLSESSIGTIPPIDLSATIDFISQKLLARISRAEQTNESEIKTIRDRFSSYSGDPSSLLGNVASYKKRQTEIERQLAQIKIEEANYEAIKQTGFSTLGLRIRESIEGYSTLIEETWARFKEGSGSLPVERRRLLDSILRDDNLNVRVEVVLDREAMYSAIREATYLDKRHFTSQLLESVVNISSVQEYYDFIEQNGHSHLFSDKIEPILRQRLIEILFKKFTTFITHRIIVESNGRSLERLSHGQKGTIYLRLQIAANLFTETIVYDQPEDDLDNKFITEELVDIFRKIKKFRQVIIVSHNANLVVNADSEQIIVADNKDGVLSYECGSLESPEIRNRVCNILEGGREAFIKRRKKYSI